MTRLEAALKGAQEIAFAVIAMTVTLAAVYAPLAFSSGRTGKLFSEFALALAGAVLVSGFVALTLSPMMCSKMLKHQRKHGRLFNVFETFFQTLTAGYRALPAARTRPPRGDRARLRRRRRLRIVLSIQIKPSWRRSRIAASSSARHRARRLHGRATPPATWSASRRSTRHPGEARASSSWPATRRRQRLLGAAFSSPGASARAASRRSPGSSAPKLQQLPGVLAFPLNPPSLGGSRGSRRCSSCPDDAGLLSRAAAHGRAADGRGAQESRSSSTSTRTCASTSRSCAWA